MSVAAPRLLFDADILIKLSVLDCFADAIAALGFRLSECATMRSMTRSAGVDNQAIREQRAGLGKPARRLFTTLRAIPTIDKMTDEEKLLSTRIAAAALKYQLAVDGGEALLFSVSICRGLPYVTTGDKKAIFSLPQLAQSVPEVAQLQGLLLPFEYLLLALLDKVGYAALEPRLAAGCGCDQGLAVMLDRAAGDSAALYTALCEKLAAASKRAPRYVRP